MNYERLPPPTLAEATELVRATVAAFQTGIGEVRTAATVLGLLAIAQAWIADQKITAGGSDVPPPMHVQQVGPPRARMTGIGAVQPIASDQPARGDLPELPNYFRALNVMTVMRGDLDINHWPDWCHSNPMTLKKDNAKARRQRAMNIREIAVYG